MKDLRLAIGVTMLAAVLAAVIALPSFVHRLIGFSAERPLADTTTRLR